jgi:hypothetical protein
VALALCGVVAAVATPSLAGTLALDDRARALTTAAAAANAAVEVGVGYPCGAASPSLPPDPSRVRLHIVDHREAHGGLRQVTAWHTPPHGGAPRPLVNLTTQVACP